ncbi:MAG: ABC transporter ATP-binding protein [Alphaproteobacteria bacterium]|nr:ABC transporter ATP-binding protein [Alphaproteobacteria bacterium]
MSALRLSGIRHLYDSTLAVDGVDLALAAGELLSLVGPSGCGKSTLLRLIAGLEPLQAGEISIGEQVLERAGAAGVPPEARGVGMVFQDYALFPHLTVLQNVAFGLDRLPVQQRRAKALAALAQVGLESLAEANPSRLSGGQQQRVALARALAPGPRVMLLDEPFSGLDTRLRRQVRDETLHLLKDSGVTTLLVTHDPDEALFMADRVALMRAGRLVQTGSPAELYYRPNGPFAAEFFGEVNRIAGRALGGRVATALGEVAAESWPDGAEVEVLVRPEAITLLRQVEDDAAPALIGRVLAARLLGRSSLVHFELAVAGGNALHLHARVPGRFLPRADERFAVRLDSSQAFVFARRDT